MPTLDEYMAMLTPQQPSQQQRIMQALGQLGVGLLSAPTWQKGLARGGLLAYDAQQQSADRAAQDQIAKLRTMQMAQDMADKDASRAQGQEDAKQLGAIFSGAPNLAAMGAGGPTPANAAAVKPPSQIEQYRKAAAFMAARGNVEGAKKLSDIADQMEGTFSTTPQVTIGPDGKPVYAQFNNKGGFRTADGVAPPPELQMLPLGDRTVAVDKLTTKPGAEFAMGQSPESKASNALGWANYGLSKERLALDQANAGTGQTNKVADLVSGVRKEYNALPAVQNYRAAAPMVESARNAPDTPAGDLDVIYAVGKSLDPNSVVREGELNLVIKAGSPAQKLMGYVSYIKNGGRLPPQQRAQLLAMLDNRVGQLKMAHDAAASPYIKQAQSLGLPMDQIFAQDKASAGPAQGMVVDGYRFKGGDPNKRENWEKAQ